MVDGVTPVSPLVSQLSPLNVVVVTPCVAVVTGDNLSGVTD